MQKVSHPTGTGAIAFTSNSSITLSAVDRINVTRGPIQSKLVLQL